MQVDHSAATVALDHANYVATLEAIPAALGLRGVILVDHGIGADRAVATSERDLDSLLHVGPLSQVRPGPGGVDAPPGPLDLTETQGGKAQTSETRLNYGTVIGGVGVLLAIMAIVVAVIIGTRH